MSSETILVVEDSREMRALVRDMLQAQGYHVAEAYSGWRALQVAESSSPDLLLLDWQLPDITGLDVLRALRAGKCQAPAVLMTGYGSEELAFYALQLGVRGYLRKPFSSEELAATINTALVEGRLRRERDALLAQLRQNPPRADVAARADILARARAPLLKLAHLIDELERQPSREIKPRLNEARRHIREIAEAIEGLPRKNQ
jgi:DNA-binding response OmpR family regulator